MMHKVNNYMIQAQAAEQAHLDLQTWMDHFETICREQGLEVERLLGGTMSVRTTAGSDMDAICKEAARRSALKDVPTQDAPLTREEYDKEVDRKEDLKEGDRERAKRRADIVAMLKAASERSSFRGDFLSALSFELTLVSIEKDLI